MDTVFYAADWSIGVPGICQALGVGDEISVKDVKDRAAEIFRRNPQADNLYWDIDLGVIWAASIGDVWFNNPSFDGFLFAMDCIDDAIEELIDELDAAD